MQRMHAFAIVAVLVAAVMGGAASANTAPQVTNVVATQRVGTHLVDITYDAFDADGDAVTIEVFLSVDGGASYPFQCTSLSGEAR